MSSSPEPREFETVELGLTGRTRQLAHDGQDPVLGHDPWICALALVRCRMSE